MKTVVITVIFVLSLFFSATVVRAEYVLPYPSYMPGNKLYSVSRIFDSLGWYWNYGKIGRLKYHLKLSDKYLVEAKTLMEYKQYLLADDALKRSDVQFTKARNYMSVMDKIVAKSYELQMNESGNKHVEILSALKRVIPQEVEWVPENDDPTKLTLQRNLDASITIRKHR